MHDLSSRFATCVVAIPQSSRRSRTLHSTSFINQTFRKPCHARWRNLGSDSRVLRITLGSPKQRANFSSNRRSDSDPVPAQGFPCRLPVDGLPRKAAGNRHLRPSGSVSEERLSDVESGDAWLVENILDHVREALNWEDLAPHQHMVAEGMKLSHGLRGSWRCVSSPSGAYVEEAENDYFSHVWGFDESGSAWDVDHSGFVSALELDDREVAFLTAWVRTGHWLSPAVATWLQITMAQPHELALLPLPEDAGCKLGPSILPQVLKLQLREGKVAAYIILEPGVWLPSVMLVGVYGTVEHWQLSGWQRVSEECRRRVCVEAKRMMSPGGDLIYKTLTLKTEVQPPGGESTLIFRMPSGPAATNRGDAGEVRFLEGVGSEKLKAVKTKSGHWLVSPLINGQHFGYFVLDSGAEMSSISPAIAKVLGLTMFGEIVVTTAVGTLSTQLARGRHMALGPLEIRNPLFVVCQVSAGFLDETPVVGICGSDIFRHCVVEMSWRRSSLTLHNPATYELPPAGVSWEPLKFMSSIPHIKARIQISPGAPPREVLFLLDTGAGGTADVYLHSRFCQMAQVGIDNGVPNASVRGVGTSTTEVVEASVTCIEVAGQSAENLSGYFARPGSREFDVSEHSAGILGGRLIARFDAIFDYARSQIALTTPQ